MRHRHFFTTCFMAAATGVLLAGACLPAAADEADKADKAKPLALRKIMQDMGKNMQAITDGISHEDWETVAKVAPLIADHPQPPLTEKMRILGFFGTDAGKFKSHDEKAHQAALALKEAAVRGDGPAVIASFATLQNTCLACHQAFRKPFVEHFYEQR